MLLKNTLLAYSTWPLQFTKPHVIFNAQVYEQKAVG